MPWIVNGTLKDRSITVISWLTHAIACKRMRTRSDIALSYRNCFPSTTEFQIYSNTDDQTHQTESGRMIFFSHLRCVTNGREIIHGTTTGARHDLTNGAISREADGQRSVAVVAAGREVC